MARLTGCRLRKRLKRLSISGTRWCGLSPRSSTSRAWPRSAPSACTQRSISSLIRCSYRRYRRTRQMGSGRGLACARIFATKVLSPVLLLPEADVQLETTRGLCDVCGQRFRRARRSAVDRDSHLQLVRLRRTIRDQVAHGGAESLASRSAAAKLLRQPRPARLLNALVVKPGRAFDEGDRLSV